MFMTELIHEFLFDCKVWELSDLTCSNYEKQLNKFRHFVREIFQLIVFEELTPIHVKQYRRAQMLFPPTLYNVA